MLVVLRTLGADSAPPLNLPSPLAGIDLIASFYGCLYAGCVPVTVRPPHPQNLAATLPTVRMIIDVSAVCQSPLQSANREAGQADCLASEIQL